MIKDKRITLPIAEIIEETAEVRTFKFDAGIEASPGQFIMLTDFNGGEKPFSISDTDGKSLSVTIKRVGQFTARLFEKRIGDIVSIRGAYGSSFFIPGKNSGPNIDAANFRPALCGGGFGLPPLYLLAKKLLKAGVPAGNIKVISAGRTENDLLFEKQFGGLGVDYTGAAESVALMSPGRFKGTAAGAFAEIAKGVTGLCNFVYASGPDLMMKSLMPHFSEELEYQFLFERYMKCAIGICGSCVVDPSGIRICKEGPALWKAQVEQLKDFGVYRRKASGSIDYFTDRMAVKAEGAGE
ncbi:MAG: hypothetical protein JEZ04_13465 [Spirochaetales bacterium]|nr:hypothetical protein [Spirochaetales bacterium]